jgi:hypothetical protein
MTSPLLVVVLSSSSSSSDSSSSSSSHSRLPVETKKRKPEPEPSRTPDLTFPRHPAWYPRMISRPERVVEDTPKKDGCLIRGAPGQVDGEPIHKVRRTVSPSATVLPLPARRRAPRATVARPPRAPRPGRRIQSTPSGALFPRFLVDDAVRLVCDFLGPGYVALLARRFPVQSVFSEYSLGVLTDDILLAATHDQLLPELLHYSATDLDRDLTQIGSQPTLERHYQNGCYGAWVRVAHAAASTGFTEGARLAFDTVSWLMQPTFYLEKAQERHPELRPLSILSIRHGVLAKMAGSAAAAGQMATLASLFELRLTLPELPAENWKHDGSRTDFCHEVGCAGARAGRLEAVAWALTKFEQVGKMDEELKDGLPGLRSLPRYWRLILQSSSEGGHVPIVERALGSLGSDVSEYRFTFDESVKVAAQGGHLGVLQVLHRHSPSRTEAVLRKFDWNACHATPADRLLDLFQWICSEPRLGDPARLLLHAASLQSVPAVQWLWSRTVPDSSSHSSSASSSSSSGSSHVATGSHALPSSSVELEAGSTEGPVVDRSDLAQRILETVCDSVSEHALEEFYPSTSHCPLTGARLDSVTSPRTESALALCEWAWIRGAHDVRCAWQTSHVPIMRWARSKNPDHCNVGHLHRLIVKNSQVLHSVVKHESPSYSRSWHLQAADRVHFLMELAPDSPLLYPIPPCFLTFV